MGFLVFLVLVGFTAGSVWYVVQRAKGRAGDASQQGVADSFTFASLDSSLAMMAAAGAETRADGVGAVPQRETPMLNCTMASPAKHVTVQPLHGVQANPYAGWSATDCVSEVERLRQQYIQWKYPDAEPRLQRVVAVVPRPGR